MSEHIGFNEERDFERGKQPTSEQKKHAKSCLPCKMRLESVMGKRTPSSDPGPSGWERFISRLKAAFSRKKSP